MGIVRLSHLADNDLDGIRDYIHQHNSRAANPSADGIHVARIVHGARDFPAVFRK